MYAKIQTVIAPSYYQQHFPNDGKRFAGSETHHERHVTLGPVDVRGEDYPSDTLRVFKNKELHAHNEYHTPRQVLTASGQSQNGDLH